MSDITDIKIKTLLMDIDYVSRLIDGLEDESVDVIKELVSHYEVTKDSQWVSVDDRLPEEGQQVLAYGITTGNQHTPVTLDCIYSGRVKFISNISHWKPLQLPPQTGESE